MRSQIKNLGKQTYASEVLLVQVQAFIGPAVRPTPYLTIRSLFSFLPTARQPLRPSLHHVHSCNE
jgi:hypothetical protein